MMYPLWARINGKDYPITYGSVVTDTFSETLDSATIIIPHVNEIIDIKPYDDVIIHSVEWDESQGKQVQWCEANHHFQEIYQQGEANANSPHSPVYRHMLCESPNRRQVNYNDYYTYTLSCVSETKGLEFPQMPNRTITQPKVSDVVTVVQAQESAKTIYFWIQTFVNTYSPKIKYTADGETWEYRSKYSLHTDVEDKFVSTKCPEMTFGGTTLREALTKLMNVLDCIPVVHDNVITFLDMSNRNKKFSDRREEMREILSNDYHISSADIEEKYPSFCDHEGKDQIPNQGWQNWMMSGGEYADRLRTEYHGAISEQNSTRYVEKLGFRNHNVSSMTLENLQIELSHPIYKINKIYLEYYKKDIENPTKAVLVKYDITPLVKLNSERQMLSHDWSRIANFDTFSDYYYNGFTDISHFADFYFFTVGYNIGSTTIDGWGETINFKRDGILSQQHSTLENIILIVSLLSYYGSAQIEALPMEVEGNSSLASLNVIRYNDVSSIGWNRGGGYNVLRELAEVIVTPAGEDNERELFLDAVQDLVDWTSQLFTGCPALTDYTPILKSVFFEIDYEGMIEGTVISTKDYHDGSVVRRDAVSSALSVVETAGALEKQKANKLGNATLVTNQRISDPRFLMQIGDYDKDDMIVYQRTVSYTRDYLNVTYYQCKDYVLKNYYTSVYSKIRPFSLTSYEESVTRNENHYQVALFSNTQFYYQESSENFDKGYEVADAISFLLPNAVFSWDVSKAQDTTPIVWKDEENPTRYLLERQNFVSGNSLCMVFTMPDSASMGTYITNWNPSVNQYLKEKYGTIFNFSALEMPNVDGRTIGNYVTAASYATDKGFLQELTGTIQNWHMMQTEIEPIDVCFSELILDSTNDVFGDDGSTRDITDVMNVNQNNQLYSKLMQLPKLPYDYNANNEKIKFTDTVKDQKERLNSTAQLEFVSDSDDIFVTQWAARLSDANGAKIKSWAYRKDSVIWFWILQTAYATDGTKTSVIDINLPRCGYMYETNSEYYQEGKDYESFITSGWNTNVQNPCVVFPALMVATNTESESVLDELRRHGENNPLAIDDLTVTWGNHSVKVVEITFNSDGIADSMTIQGNGWERTVPLLDLNDDNASTSVVKESLRDDPHYTSENESVLMYPNYCRFNMMTVKKANAVSSNDTLGERSIIQFLDKTFFSKFAISQTTRMWGSHQKVADFLVNSDTLGNEYPVFFYAKYALIHLGFVEERYLDYVSVDGREMFTGLARPEYCYMDQAVENIAFPQIDSTFGSSTYDSLDNKYYIRDLAFCKEANPPIAYSWGYASDCGKGNNVPVTGRISAVYIPKPQGLATIGGGTLYITYSPDKVDAKIADSLVSTDSIPSGETQLYDVTLFNNNLSVELDNRQALLAAIRRNAGSNIVLKARFNQGANVQNGGSIRIYYKDSDKNGDGMVHLVFALNTYTAYSDYIITQFSVSILDDRSKTVIDEHGEPLYRIVNYAEDEDAPDELGNYCVKK